MIILISAWLSKVLLPHKKELSRKIVHIGIGPVILLAWWLNISLEIAISCASVITFFLLVNYRLQLIPIFEDIERKSFGTVLYGVTITLLLILFWKNNPDAVCAGVLVMALGDGLAGLIGKQIKSPYWIILGQRKSIVGTLTMSLVSAIVLYITNFLGGSSLEPLQIFAITSMAVGFEQISPLGIDNFTVPLTVGIIWQQLS